MSISAATDPVAPGIPISVTYVRQSGLFRICIVNFLLNLVTLSIFRFWAKTKVRRHIWSCVRINGEPLEYTGTGMELFLGALVVFLILILPIIIAIWAITLLLGPNHPAIYLVNFVMGFLILLLYGMAIYRARRYRLSRTLWRGIRGTLVGSPWSYSLIYFGALILRSMTFGWSTPAMNLELQQRLTREMRFGETTFFFRGRAGPLYPAYALSWFGTMLVVLVVAVVAGGEVWFWFGERLADLMKVFDPAASPQTEPGPGRAAAALSIAGIIVSSLLALYLLIGMTWTIYQAREMMTFWSYTGIDRAQFKINSTVGSLIRLWLGNIAIFLFTLGIGAPYLSQRNIRYVCDRLTIEGTVDVDRIVQSRQPIDRRGEGLADAFDIDLF